MHRTASTAITLNAHVVRDHRADVWAVHLAAFAASDRTLQGTLAFDAAYWSAGAVETILDVLRATLEASYEL